jgi:hypothetical protein
MLKHGEELSHFPAIPSNRLGRYPLQIHNTWVFL